MSLRMQAHLYAVWTCVTNKSLVNTTNRWSDNKQINSYQGEKKLHHIYIYSIYMYYNIIGFLHNIMHNQWSLQELLFISLTNSGKNKVIEFSCSSDILYIYTCIRKPDAHTWTCEAFA